MDSIVKFPIKKIVYEPLPRQRFFYLGYKYIGPTLCQEIQHLYLKRKGLIYGTKWWATITYGKYSCSEKREYSLELEECEEEAVPDLLEMFDMREICSDKLRSMGRRGKRSHSAEIKSIFHTCYDGLRFPTFAAPYKKKNLIIR